MRPLTVLPAILCACGPGWLSAADAGAPDTPAGVDGGAPARDPNAIIHGDPLPAPTKDTWTAPASVPAGVARLAAAVWRQLPSGGNLAISPCSLHACLAMTSAGARGATLNQMERAAELPAPKLLPNLWKETAAALVPPSAPSPPWRWDMANRLFVQQGYALSQPFLATCASAYGSSVAELDFTSHTAAAIDAINAWCAASTERMVTQLVDSTSVLADTRVVLADAVYFKADWEDPFPKELSATAPFHRPGQVDAQATFMHGTRVCEAAEIDGAAEVVLPFSQEELDAVLVVPEAVDGLAKIEARLDSAELGRLLEAPTSERRIRLALPRLHLATEVLHLATPLQALGMRDAFLPDRADFSAMSNERLYVGDVLQRCVVDLDEQGATAAAASAVAMRPGALPPPIEPMVVTADHPFLLAIRHRSSGTILFLARVADPSA